MKAREIMRRLEANGWQLKRQKGSHKQFKHPDYPHLITVPDHPGDLKPGIAAAILKRAGVKQ